MRAVKVKIAVMAVILIALCVLTRISRGNVYHAYIPVNPGHAEDTEIQLEKGDPGVISFENPQTESGVMEVDIHPEKPGEADALLEDPHGIGSSSMRPFRVGPLLTVIDMSTGGFTGDTIVMAAFAVFCLYTAWLLFNYYRKCRGPEIYSYRVLFAAGFGIFSLTSGILLAVLTVQKILMPARFTMLSAYSRITGASFTFIMVTFPVIVVFSAMLAASNVELLRHERRRLANLLGILLSALLVAGALLAFFLYGRDFSGSEMQMRIHNTLQNLYATVYVYFECMLFGAVVSGLRAARHIPDMDKDYILILGCGFRKDGTLTPLLRGRADRAVRFWREQREKTGKTAMLVPSGGQGPNEVMPEAEAIARYLVQDCGISEQHILKEDRSLNTYQNMLFSKQLIEGRSGADAAGPNAPGPDMPGTSEDASVSKTIFATTNYHVFRSGVWASLAGLKAEGIGSKTKWWFWPNAFIRECIGLIKNRIREEVLLLAILAAFFGTISMVLV